MKANKCWPNQYWILLLLVVVFISGCGFHLRGFLPIPPQLKTLYVTAPDPYDPFVVNIRNRFISMGANVVNNPNEAPVTFQILSSAFTQQLTSIAANTQTRTFLLRDTLTFQLLDAAGKIIYGPQTVVSTSTFQTGSDQLLADSNLLAMQQKEMERDLIFRILMRINSSEGRIALNNIKLPSKP